MSLQIVVIEYPLDEGGHNMEKVYDLICSYGSCEQLTEHSFLLNSDIPSTELRDAIKDTLVFVDSIFLSNVKPSAAWRNLMCDNEDIVNMYHNEAEQDK